MLGDQVQISVADEGPGIPPSELQQIFSQFYRIAANKHSSKGAGLGLYISKEIMEAHQGKIWAESIPGKGATFYITFPVERVSTKA